MMPLRVFHYAGRGYNYNEIAEITGKDVKYLRNNFKMKGEARIIKLLRDAIDEKSNGKIACDPKNSPIVIFRALQRGAFVDPVHLFRMDLVGFNKYLSGTLAK